MDYRPQNPDDEDLFPEPENVEEFYDDFDDSDDSSGSSWFSMSGWLRVFAVAMGLILLGSILIPVIGPLFRGVEGTPDQGSEPAVSPEERSYTQWLNQRVRNTLASSVAAGRARYIGVQFDDSIGNPVVGLLINYPGSEGSLTMAMLERVSTDILQNLFDDDRAENVVLAWVKPSDVNREGQTTTDLVLVIGMLRQTADEIDWLNFDPARLRQVADLYREVAAVEALTAWWRSAPLIWFDRLTMSGGGASDRPEPVEGA